MDFPIKDHILESAKQGDLKFIISCVKEDILLSVNDQERSLSSTWIDDALMLPKFAFMKRPMADEFFILKKNGKDVGMIWLGKSRDQFTIDDVGYILGIYVVPESRGRGLGKALMSFAEEWTKEKGLISLALNVGIENKNAVGFYEHLGFVTQTKVMRKSLR